MGLERGRRETACTGPVAKGVRSMAFSGLLILASGVFLMTLAGLPGVNRGIRWLLYQGPG